MSTKTALVIGATGVLGPEIAWALTSHGYRIRTLSRREPERGLLPSDAEVFTGDITEPATIDRTMTNVNLVVHLAALLHIVNPLPSQRADYERVNVGGTANVVAAAIQAGAERIVSFSTIAVYGDSGGEILNEDSPLNPRTFYARTKLAAEDLVLGARGSDGRPLGTVLRLAAVYGARLKGNYRRLVLSLARRRFIPIGNGCNRRTLVYHKDVAAATVLAASHQLAPGRVYNVTDGKLHTLTEIVSTICQSLDRKPPRLSIPLTPARLGAAMLEDAGRLAGHASPVGRETIEKYIEDIAVDGGRIQRELGFVPQFDLRTGWRQTIQEMRSNGEL
jgi:nucleoside-diphosphate-sugar epimerase